MNDSLAVMEQPRAANSAEFDAIIIGAGISGMFMLYRLREL
jgi:cation diffusion facilitator CzcD-associated flavoprotein CzcO